MNHRRRLLAVWIAASLCWIGYWVWQDVATCRLLPMGSGHAIACHWQANEAGTPVVMERTAPALPVLWHMLAQAIILPLGLLIAGVLVERGLDMWRGSRG